MQCYLHSSEAITALPPPLPTPPRTWLLIVDSRVAGWRPQVFRRDVVVWLLGSWSECVLQMARQQLPCAIHRHADAADATLDSLIRFAHENYHGRITVTTPTFYAVLPRRIELLSFIPAEFFAENLITRKSLSLSTNLSKCDGF